MRDIIKSKDALLASKDALIAFKDAKMKETQGDLVKVSKDLSTIMARFTKPPMSSASSSSSSSLNDSRDDPSGNRTRLISSRTITARAPVSSTAPSEPTRRVRVLASTAASKDYKEF